MQKNFDINCGRGHDGCCFGRRGATCRRIDWRMSLTVLALSILLSTGSQVGVAQEAASVDFPAFDELMQPGGALPVPTRSPQSQRLAVPQRSGQSDWPATLDLRPRIPATDGGKVLNRGESGRSHFDRSEPGRQEFQFPNSNSGRNATERTNQRPDRSFEDLRNAAPVSQSRSFNGRLPEDASFDNRAGDRRNSAGERPFGPEQDGGFTSPRDDRGPNDGNVGTDGYQYNSQQLGIMRIVDAEAAEADAAFDWKQKTMSIADLRFPTATVFQHNDDFMTLPEEEAYLDLMATVERQRQRLLKRSREDRSAGDDPTAIWEEAFYQYPRARKLAWDNGQLRKVKAKATVNGLADPFRSAIGDVPVDDSKVAYKVLDDIARFPQDFVGRPIVLYGRFTAASEVRLLPGKKSASTAFDDRSVPSRADFEKFGKPQGIGGRGDGATGLGNGGGDEFPEPLRTEQRLLRGTLTGLTDTRQLALVDTRGLVTPSSGLEDIDSAWRNESAIPVMIKGWVVKQWKDSRPLIYCESMRLITPRPHADLIAANTIDKRRLRDEETWLYYETLNQLMLTSSSLQKEIAAVVQKQRIDTLMAEIMEKSEADLKALASRRKSGALNETTFQRQKGSLQRRLDQRLDRYRRYRRDPDDFPTYVDLFQHPDKWHGQLVRLKGHVRHVISYPGDEMLFGGRRLHELWLFTDDSQHNPAVIVTPNLPPDFPIEADVINCVTATGCFFKRYVYGSQDTSRIAPLILAENIQWQPTIDQVQTLIADGHLSPGSPRAVRAAAIAGDKTSDTVVLMITFCVVLGMMVMWGRAQREERDRVRLRHVVNEAPVFETPGAESYASLLHDYDDNDAVDILLRDNSEPDFRPRQ